MSINPINSAGSNNSASETKKYERKIKNIAAGGFVLGTVGQATRKNWLYKGMPSDSFIKSVGRELEKTMTSDEIKEASRINTFLYSVVDPEVDMETLKPQIRDSKELSEAIKASPDESVEQAITRVFSKPDKAEVKQELIDLQYKTLSDKKSDRNTSLKLIHDNFDAKNKKLVKSETTAEGTFNMLKKTARTIQVKSALIGGALTGVIASALYVATASVPGENKHK